MGRIGKRIRQLLCVSALALVVLVAAGWIVTLLLSRPNPASIGEPPQDLAAHGVMFRSGSGTALRGWFVEGQRGRGAVALLHGVHANRLAMLGRARALSAAGFAVLLFDFQAHGESEGDAITFGYRERLDARAAVAYLHRTVPDERIGVIGVSMGGAASLLAMPDLDIDALVLEQVYPTIDDALDNRLRICLGPLGALVSPLLEREMSWHLGLDPRQLRPIDHISDVRMPLLIVVGETDQHTTLPQSRALFAAAHEPKQLWIVPGAAHVDLQTYAGDLYAQRVLGFLEPLLTTTQVSQEPALQPRRMR